MLINFILIVIVIAITGAIIFQSIAKKKEQKVEQAVEVVDDKTYTLEKIIALLRKDLMKLQR